MTRQKKKSLPASMIVTQSNQLVEARYNLSLSEQRLILMMISRIQPDDEDFKPYRISVGELAAFLGVDKNSAYRECKKTTENLLKRVVCIEEDDGLLQIGWVSSAKYIDGTGMVYLSFDPLLKPYLLKLKSNFTSCKLEMLMSFKSQYSVRIYNLLKQYERLKDREIALDELRQILGIGTFLHVEYRDFKKHILACTQKELSEKADIYFEFDEIKYGRKVGAIRFRIFKKIIKVVVDDLLQLPDSVPSPSEASSASSVDALLSLVLEPHRAKKTVQAAIAAYEKKHDFEYVKRNILYSNVKAEKSYAGFLNDALKSDWGHDWALDKKNVSVKKKVIEIWERQGFSSQKEYDESRYSKQMEDYGHKV